MGVDRCYTLVDAGLFARALLLGTTLSRTLLIAAGDLAQSTGTAGDVSADVGGVAFRTLRRFFS